MAQSESDATPTQRPLPCAESFVRLASTDPFSLSARQQVEHLQDIERHAAWFDSLRIDAVAALAGPGEEYGDTADADCDEDIHQVYAVEDAIQDEVAAALRVSGMAAGKRIAVARDLHFKLPTTRRMLCKGYVLTRRPWSYLMNAPASASVMPMRWNGGHWVRWVGRLQVRLVGEFTEQP